MTIDDDGCLGMTWDDKGKLRMTGMTIYENGLFGMTSDD